MKLISSLFITSVFALFARAEENPAASKEPAKKAGEEQSQDADKRRAEMREKFKNLPPEVREMLKNLTPEMREKLRNMSPEERQAAIAEMRKKFHETHPEATDKKAGGDATKPSEAKAEDAKSPEANDEKKNRRAEMIEKMKDMSPEERQAFIEKMKQKRDQRGEKNDIQEGGVIPKRP